MRGVPGRPLAALGFLYRDEQTAYDRPERAMTMRLEHIHELLGDVKPDAMRSAVQEPIELGRPSSNAIGA